MCLLYVLYDAPREKLFLTRYPYTEIMIFFLVDAGVNEKTSGIEMNSETRKIIFFIDLVIKHALSVKNVQILKLTVLGPLIERNQNTFSTHSIFQFLFMKVVA